MRMLCSLVRAIHEFYAVASNALATNAQKTCGLVLATLATPVLASNWTSDEPLRVAQPGTPTATVLQVAVDAQGGHRAVVQLSDGRIELLHFDAAQQLLSARLRLAGDGVFAPNPRSKVVELEDGSLYALTGTFQQARLESSGEVVWARMHPYNRCLRALGAPGAVLWSICRNRQDDYALLRTDEVGRSRIRSELPIGRMTALFPAADHGVYYADFLGGASIGRFAADGSLRWFRTPTTLDDVVVEGMHELENGHVLLVGRFWNQSRLRLMERDVEGMLVSSTDLELDFDPREIQLSRRESDGSLLLLLDRAVQGADVLMHINADRSLGWIHALPEETEVEAIDLGRFALLRTAERETRLIAGKQLLVDDVLRNTYSYFAISADGQLRIQQPLGDEFEFDGFEPRPSQRDFLSAGRYARIDADGQISDLRLPVRYAGQEQPLVLAAHSEGEQRLVVVDTIADRQLQAWTRDGQLLWAAPLQRDFPVFGYLDIYGGNLLVADHAACFVTLEPDPESGFVITPMQCVDRSEGSALVSLPVEPFFGTYTVPVLLDGGTLVSLQQTEAGASVRFRAVQDGSEVRPSRALNGSQLGGAPGGVGVYFAAPTGIEAHWFDGEQPQSITIPYDSVIEWPSAISPDGLFIGSQWYPRDGSSVVDLDPALGTIVDVNVDANPLVLHRIGADGEHTLSGFDPATASISWTNALAPPEAQVSSRLARGNGDIHFLSAYENAYDIDLDIVVYRRGDGELVDRRSVDCEGPPCQLFLDGPVAGAEGLDLLMLRQQADGSSALRAVYQATYTAATTPDQAGVAGLWYHPGLQGQGFVLTYIEDSRTLFAPWFTYGSAEGGDESGVEWFSLQGQVEAGADVARMEILRNRNGSFNAPPITTPAVIGEATLRMVSCDRAVLSVSYDPSVWAQEPAQIPLLRLGSRVRPCQLADGSVEPPALAVADQNGFSIDQSGGWFDPTTSGQGLMLEVVPAGSGQDGLLFGAWFTYDLAGQANDFDAQDWFILQADLRDGQSGLVRVPIYRSIGGESLRRPTANLFVVGEAELQFSGCDHLRVSYAFAENPRAGVHAGIQGQLNLERIGGCQSR